MLGGKLVLYHWPPRSSLGTEEWLIQATHQGEIEPRTGLQQDRQFPVAR